MLMPSLFRTYYRLTADLPWSLWRDEFAENIGSSWYANTDEPFVGKLDGNSFRIILRSSRRNAFHAVLQGRIRSGGLKPQIMVYARMNTLALIFSIVWLGLACIFLGRGIYIFVKGESAVLMGISLAFIVGYLTIANNAFYSSSQEARSMLKKIVETI